MATHLKHGRLKLAFAMAIIIAAVAVTILWQRSQGFAQRTLVLDQGDAAGVLAVDERAHFVPPRSGHHHLRVFLAEIDPSRVETARKTVPSLQHGRRFGIADPKAGPEHLHLVRGSA